MGWIEARVEGVSFQTALEKAKWCRDNKNISGFHGLGGKEAMNRLRTGNFRMVKLFCMTL